MLHISVLTFFGCVFLAFVLGMSAGAWVYQRIFTWKYQKLVKKSQGAWDNWTEDDIRNDLGEALEFAKPGKKGIPQRPLGPEWNDWHHGDPDERAIFAVRTSVDAIEAALAACKHPYHADGYCITCGARNFGGIWAAPHWRDLLVDAHVFVVGDLGLIRGPIRKENHGSTEKSNDKKEGRSN
jgi:hypothetical protein